MSRKTDPFLRWMSCPYPECFNYRKAGQGNIIWWSRKQGRYKCKTCGRWFNEFSDTLFWKRKHPPELICEVLQLLAEGMSIRGISRVKKIKPETVISWRREAVSRLNLLEDYLINVCELKQVQFDEIYTFLKKKSVILEKKKSNH